MNHLYTYMIALIQNRGNTRINQDIYTKKKFATPSENFAPLKARLQLECILKSVRISKNRINSETDRYKRGIMNQLYTYMIAWIQNRGNTRIYNVQIQTSICKSFPKIQPLCDTMPQTGADYFRKRAGGKIACEARKFFFAPASKNFAPPPEGEQGDKCIQSLPKKSMKIHHFARTAKNFMHSSLIFKGEGQNSEGGGQLQSLGGGAGG